MADEINLGRLVAEIALDNQNLQDSAEDAIEAIESIEEAAEKANPEVNIKVNGTDDISEAVEQIPSDPITVDIEFSVPGANEATTKVKDYKNALNDSTDASKEQSEANEDLNEGFTVVKGVITDLASEALQAAIDKFRELMTSGKQALNAIQAQTGMTNTELSDFKDEMYDLYSQNYGESLEDVANKMSLIKQSIDETDPENIKEITKNAIAMSDTFDMDFSETVRGVNALMTNMGLTAEQAFDYMSKGAQNGLNITEELGDNLSEYTQLWSQAGFSAEEMFSILQNGIDSGAYNLDKVNDLVKEISISIVDGRVEDSLDSFSNKTAQIFEAFKNGKATQSDVFNSIIDDLNTTSGLAEKLATASNTWSALGEDNAMSVIQALNNVNNTYSDVSGTMQSINDIKYDDVGNQLAALGRKFEVDIIQPVVEGVTPALENIIKWVSDNLPLVATTFTTATTAVLGYRAAVNMSPIINAVKNSFLGLTTAKTAETVATQKATVAQAGFNSVLNANPVILLVTAISSLVVGLGTYLTASGSATEHTEKYKKAIEDAKEAAESNINKSKAEADEIRTLGEIYDELRTKTSRTSEEQQRLDIVAEKLAETLGITTSAIKDQSGAYIDLSNEIDNTIKKMEQQAIFEANESVLKEAYTQRNNAKKAVKQKELEVAEYYQNNKDIIDNFQQGDTYGYGVSETNEYNFLNNELEKLKESYKACNEAVEEYEKQLKNDMIALDDNTESTNKNAQITLYASNANIEYKNSISGTSKSFEELKSQLVSQNAALLENQNAVKKLKEEQKDLEKLGSSDKNKERLKDIKNQLSDLQKKQSEIKENIEDTKKAISDLEDTVVNAFDNMIQAQQDLQTISDEVATSNKISLSTLNDLQKKYPELTDLINDYINGRKDEADIIKAMKGIYDNDVDNYNKATKTKILASENFYQTLLDNNAKLVNDYKEKYDIDLKNYKSVQEAKVAIQAQTEAKIRAELAKTALQKVTAEQTNPSNFGNYSSALIANITGQTNMQVDAYKNVETKRIAQQIEQIDEQAKQAGQKAVEEFNKSIDKYYKNTYSVYAGVAVKGVDKNKKTGSNSNKSTTYTTKSSDGITGTGSTYAEANLDWLNKQKNLGKISVEYEINYLKKLKQYRQNTADDIYDIEYQLYQAEQKLKDENADSLNTLGDAVVNALKNRYAQQKELEEKRIDESIESWKKWEDETCEAIQGQIDALDELGNAHDEENERQEYENKRQALELQARYEKDDYNRKQIQKEIAALDKDENERLFNLQIEQQKKALQEQMDSVSEISQKHQNELNEEKDVISEKYNEMTSDFALKAEAQKTILKSSQKELIALINSYAPEYEMAGTSLGESLYNGFKSKTGNISGYVSTITAGVDNATSWEKKQSVKNAESFWKSENSYYNSLLSTSANKSSEVKQTQSILDKLAARVDSLLNSISSTATAYKNQMAITANAAADRYYSTQQYYTNSTQSNSKSATNIYMTVNFNDKVDSPIEVKRQMEYVSQQLAKQINS